MTNQAAADLPDGPLIEARVLGAAVELTRTQGLGSWTVGRLAYELELDVRTVHDHAGDRADIDNAVLATVAGLVPPVPAKRDLTWRQRLRRHAGALRSVLGTYPGCAARLAGWAGSAAEPVEPLVCDIAALLENAGFGSQSTELARVFLVQVCLLASLDDDHQRRGSPRWLTATHGLVFYGRSVDVLLDGLAAAEENRSAGTDAPWRTVPAHPFDPGPPEFA